MAQDLKKLIGKWQIIKKEIYWDRVRKVKFHVAWTFKTVNLNNKGIKGISQSRVAHQQALG